jgi:hypothetical protein
MSTLGVYLEKKKKKKKDAIVPPIATLPGQW